MTYVVRMAVFRRKPVAFPEKEADEDVIYGRDEFFGPPK
jgi:hypothetical protein